MEELTNATSVLDKNKSRLTSELKTLREKSEKVCSPRRKPISNEWGRGPPSAAFSSNLL